MKEKEIRKEINNNFIENYKIDYNKSGQVTKRGSYDYISWAYVQKIMREQYPDMKWSPVWNEQTQSLIWSGFVKLLFTNKEEQWEIFYPILDNRNKSIMNPNQFDLNNAQMRGFAKGFAMITGHGLNLFTGEDLEQYKTVEKIKENQDAITKIKEIIKEHEEYKKLNETQQKNILLRNTTINELSAILKRMDAKKGDDNGK